MRRHAELFREVVNFLDRGVLLFILGDDPFPTPIKSDLLFFAERVEELFAFDAEARF